MVRIDKLICENSEYSRSEIKKLIKKGLVSVNGHKVLSADTKVDEDVSVFIDQKPLKVRKHIYLMLNKPKGFVSATEDSLSHTVLELIPREYAGKKLFPAGRLDKDTTGFMIITDDGDFAHRILSPKNHVEKVYLAQLDTPVTDEMIRSFEQGVTLFDGSLCMRAELSAADETGLLARVVLREGMYHQIKRMFGVFNAGVNELRRIEIGSVPLDASLREGECRELTLDELSKIDINSRFF
ncbi:MAG: rRNA pseudouridine synthase [Clostridia bacterium]|nr:rRNA pseudouridine synthase [Clostridia bacterium]